MSRKNRLFINDVDSCVDDMLQGVAMGNPNVHIIKGHRVIVTKDIKTNQERGLVTVISGGGSGHEPFAAGFVGQGMLTAAVAGSVFASPPPNDILAALRAVESSAGTLVIVANYTGDRLNFGMAVERAKLMGIKTSMVVVGEDCALASHDKTAGRRGLVGIVNIIKIAGALSEQGRSLGEITEITKQAAENMGTIGVSLSACSVPGTGSSFQLPETEMELGLGAHGEAGVKRMRLLPANETVEVMIDHMLDEDNASRFDLIDGDKISCRLNNFGGLSELEMHVLARRVMQYLEKKGAAIEFFYVGHYMTSIDMAGFNINVMKLNPTTAHCLNAYTTAPAWNHFPRVLTKDDLHLEYLTIEDKLETQAENNEIFEPIPEIYLDALKNVCNALIENESLLNELDTTGGDGDCGSTLKRGATEILASMEYISKATLSKVFTKIASCAESTMGGASGGLYSLLFTAAASVIKDGKEIQNWFDALEIGMAAMSRYGGAEVGDRTMLDPLNAIANSLAVSIGQGRTIESTLADAAEAALLAANETVGMKAYAGRASYVASSMLTQPDPGAMAVSIWMNQLSK